MTSGHMEEERMIRKFLYLFLVLIVLLALLWLILVSM